MPGLSPSRGTVRRWADAVLRRSPAQPLLRQRSARHLVVLAYHGIDDPDRFEDHLRYLRRYARPVSLQEVLDAMAGRSALPERSVLLTFDDGERSLLEVGAPLLRERGIPGVAFVVAGLLDAGRPLWTAEAHALVRRGATAPSLPDLDPAGSVRYLRRAPDHLRLQILEELRASGTGPVTAPQLRREELRTLEEAGISVQSHSLTHACLPACPGEKVRSEIEEAHEILTAALGRDPVAFAYPDGQVDPRAIPVLTELGYRMAFLFDHRLTPFPPADPFRVSRARLDAWASVDRLSIVVSGLHPAVHGLRTRLRPRGALDPGPH